MKSEMKPAENSVVTTGDVASVPEQVHKYPELVPLRDKYEAKVKAIEEKTAPLKKQQDALIVKIQALELEKKKVDDAIKAIERPANQQESLAFAKNQLGGLAKAMGARSMGPEPAGVGVSGGNVPMSAG